jgi:hypothetical protein
MERLGRLFRKLRMLLGGERLRRELEEEVAFHLEQPEAEFRSAGMGPDEAARAARRQFGNDVRLRDEGCETVAFWFENMLQDFPFALRQLRKES